MDLLNKLFGIETHASKPIEIKVGEQFNLKKNEKIRLGRGEFPIAGHTVYQLSEAKNNLNLSSYGVEIFYGSDGAIVVQKPNLQINGKQYLSSNTISVSVTRDKWHEIERVYNAGPGINLNQIKVQGNNDNNFIVELVDGDTFKLLSLKSIT